ncbi:MAG: VanZ family protein [Deltaproteobacteria bacterium]|nr:VanZ family protein [Deltaproteobacteria bacterium]
MNASQPLTRPWILILWIASVATVIYLSLTPRIDFPYDFSNADKVYHMLAYLWLAVLPFFAFPSPKAALAGTIGMIPLGAGLEIAQHYVPGRSFSLADMAANALGVFLGLWLARYAKRLRFR